MAAPAPSFRFEPSDFTAIANCLRLPAATDVTHGASFSLDSVTELSLAETSVIILRSGLFSASLTGAYGYLMAPRHCKVLVLCGKKAELPEESSCHLEICRASEGGQVTFRLVSPSPQYLHEWQLLNCPAQRNTLLPAPPEAGDETREDSSSQALRDCDSIDAWIKGLETLMEQDPYLPLETALLWTSEPLMVMLRCADDPIGLRVADFVKKQQLHMAGLTSDALESVVATIGGFVGGIHQLLLLTFPVLAAHDVLEQAVYFAIHQAVLPPLHHIIFPLFLIAHAQEDAQWHASRIRLENTTPAALGVPRKHLDWVGVEGPNWDKVCTLLREVVTEASALAKLWGFKKVVAQLLVCARACKGNACILGADDLMPVLEFAALTTPQLPCLSSNLQFAASLMPQSLELGEMGYLVVVGQTIQSALIYNCESLIKQSERRVTCVSSPSEDIERRRKAEAAEKLLDRLHKMHDHLTIA